MAVASPPVFELPQRGLFDVVAANDVASLLTLVRGDNPFDVSPGMELIRLKRRNTRQPYAENAGVMASAEVKIDVAQIPRTRDGRGNGAAHVAASKGFVSMLEVLVEECGCGVDEYNEQGLTALHVAALHGHLDCVRLLCDLGAEPLCTTRIGTAASTTATPSLRGRTSLFLAHYAQQHDVVTFLLPFYAPLIKSACHGQSPAQVWDGAATQHNSQMLSLLLDTMECAGAMTGPLPLHLGLDVVAGLMEALPSVLSTCLPQDHRISREQLFLFERLTVLGYVRGQTALTASETVLGRVLATAQVKAWRVLVRAGVVQPDRCEIEAVQSCGYSGNGETELRLLIAEAQARRAYERAKRAYTEKGDTPTRRASLLDSRESWKALERKLRHRGITPVRVS